LKVHHFGFVVRDIAQASASFHRLFSIEPSTPVVHDSLQRVAVTFLPLRESVHLELIEPVGAGSPVERFLGAGGGLHHICFQTQNIQADVEKLRQLGMVLVCGPTPAAAFANRKISFLYGSETGLVELLEDDGR